MELEEKTPFVLSVFLSSGLDTFRLLTVSRPTVVWDFVERTVRILRQLACPKCH
ncbi:hypothetical protein M407DRAFT_130474 [Tulasnella calospora MUT 4182]|uniref:Uncharacterized protein n=1 Tax=Tulasnella calospora MUT 4182 TaxID=1051891 RepID=A0A0C3KI26_9AGAM|nr:hypothetical protein M407DRAFT_130474 [Tulasnella calospora MUT 4182]